MKLFKPIWQNFLLLLIIVLLALKFFSKHKLQTMDQIKKSLKENPVARWGILILISFIMAANYYFYDAISPLKRLLEENFSFSSSDFGLFVSFYSIPNTFFLMAVLGGIILDKIGIRITGFTFTFFMVIGAFLTAYGASEYYNNGGVGYEFMGSFLPGYSPTLKMMLLGRFFFGLGAETSIVVISKIIVKWFKGKEIAMAFAINLAIARLGSFAAFHLSPFIAINYSPWTLAIWFAAILLGIGLITFMIYMMFDIKIDKQIGKMKLMDKDEEFQIKDVGKLLKNRSFILIALLCVTFYSAVFPFQSFSPDFFLNKFGVSLQESGQIASLLALGTMIFTPIFGWFVDKKGYSASLMIYGSLLLILVHLTFSLTSINPIFPMIVLGIAFSLVPAAMWPSVAKIVDEHRIGTAYGAMFSIQNLGLWAFPLLMGIVLDATNPGITPEVLASGEGAYNYTYTILMLAGLGVFGLFFALLLKKNDKTSGYGLELPSNTTVEP